MTDRDGEPEPETEPTTPAEWIAYMRRQLNAPKPEAEASTPGRT